MRFVTMLRALLMKDIQMRKFKRAPLYTLMLFGISIILLEMLRYVMVLFEEAEEMGIDGVIPPDPGTIYDPIGPFPGLLELDKDTVLYLPRTRYSDKVVLGAFHGRPGDGVVGLNTHQEFEAYPKPLESINRRYVNIFGIYFPKKAVGKHLRYTLRYEDLTITSGEEEALRLVPLMACIFREHVRYFKPDAKIPQQIMQPFPTMPSHENTITLYKTEVASMCILLLGTLGYMIFFIDFCNKTIQDKESRLKELLKMMGMSDAVYWVNVLCVGLSIGLPMCLISTGQLFSSMGRTPFVEKASAGIVFVILLFFVIGTMIVILLISVIFQTAKGGSIALTIYLFASQFLFYHFFGLTNACLITEAEDKLRSSVIPTFAFTWAVKLLFAYELEGGANFGNLFEGPSGAKDVGIGNIFIAQLVSWVFWMCIILYIDAVNPWQHGIPKGPFFCLERCAWWRKPATYKGPSRAQKSNSARIEPMPPEAGEPVIRVVNVTHSFDDFKVINNLSLELYKNQISVLLGHNGAGKTTIMNIMTGLFPPDKGDIFINKYSITKATELARLSIGLCPQHNVLFDYLTVEEHLRFFGKLKGAATHVIVADIDRILKQIGLLEKKHDFPASLSGGMKRKLSLANAAIGGSRILILDEPSSGLDPDARRSVWEFLKKERERRTILMTTHHMEEADILADRVLLLARGRLMSAGSPMFLKKIFETGYKIRVSKEGPKVDSEAIISTVKDELGDSSGAKFSVVTDMGFEIVMNIGFPPSEKMIEVFRKLEADQKKLKITNIGASVTTMEDVFVRVGEIDDAEAEAEGAIEPKDAAVHPELDRLPRFEALTGCGALCRQIQGLWWKRFHSLKREWKFLLYLLLWPLLFTFLFISMVEDISGVAEAQRISMKSLFGRTLGFTAGKLDGFLPNAKRIFAEEGVDFVGQLERIDNPFINGFLMKQHNKSEAEYRTRWSVGLASNKLWFNMRKKSLSIAALAHFQSGALTQLMGERSKVEVSIWPYTQQDTLSVKTNVLKVRLIGSALIAAALAMMTGPIISYPVSERRTKSKLLQLMTGVNPAVFHGVSFAFDLLVQGLVAGLLLGMLLTRNPSGCFSQSPDTIYCLSALFLAYVAAMIPLAHFCSMIFSESGSAATMFISFNIVPVCIAGAVISFIEIVSSAVGQDPLDYKRYIDYFSWHPTFAVTWGTTSIILNGLTKKLCVFLNTTKHAAECESNFIPSCCQVCGPNATDLCYEYQSSFSDDLRFGAGSQIPKLLIVGLICSIIVVLLDCQYECLLRLLDDSRQMAQAIEAQQAFFDELPEDEDVAKEQLAVDNIVAEDRTALYSLVAHRLVKRYGYITVVDHVSFHVAGNECFGLLGVNGAGKTTIFSMLTGDMALSEGEAFIEGICLASSPQDYQRKIGYCPQFDALSASATGKEQLELFCALRGVPREQTQAMIKSLTKAFDLVPHIDKQVQKCSGGNKRKISLAAAVVGYPVILLLDEPTAGVDPGARRRIYRTLSQLQKQLDMAIVLTSHSMEVCEAVCSRVAIMVSGSFRCLGPTQHLKSKYGNGYTVQIKLKEALEESEESDLSRVMNSIFGDKCTFKQKHMTQFQYYVNDKSFKWSEIFEKVQELRKHTEFNFEDIQVSDVTLDEVFLKFGKQ